MDSLQGAVDDEKFLRETLTNLQTSKAIFRDSRLLSRVVSSVLNILDQPTSTSRLDAQKLLLEYLELLPPEMLLKYDYTSVFLDALLRILLSRDQALVGLAFDCSISILEIILNDSTRSRSKTDFGKLSYEDKQIIQTLNEMESVPTYSLKALLAENLIKLIRRRSFTTSKFFGRIVSIAEHFSDSLNDALLFSTLQLLDGCCSCFSFLLANHCDRIFAVTVKVLLVRPERLRNDPEFQTISRRILEKISQDHGPFMKDVLQNIVDEFPEDVVQSVILFCDSILVDG